MVPAAVRRYGPTLEHFARALLDNGQRLAGPEVAAALRAALEHQDRLITAALATSHKELHMSTTDDDIELTIRQRAIAETLHDAQPERPWAELWREAETLAVRNVRPEHAVKALEHVRAERSTGIIRHGPAPKLTTTPRGRTRRST